MSADNWTICPRCVRTELAKKRERQVAADAAYGKVPVLEWKVLEAAAQAEPVIEHTFREDWEIGLSGDRFSVHYIGGCGKCGFKLAFDHEQNAEPAQ